MNLNELTHYFFNASAFDEFKSYHPSRSRLAFHNLTGSEYHTKVAEAKSYRQLPNDNQLMELIDSMS